MVCFPIPILKAEIIGPTRDTKFRVDGSERGSINITLGDPYKNCTMRKPLYIPPAEIILSTSIYLYLLTNKALIQDQTFLSSILHIKKAKVVFYGSQKR